MQSARSGFGTSGADRLHILTILILVFSVRTGKRGLFQSELKCGVKRQEQGDVNPTLFVVIGTFLHRRFCSLSRSLGRRIERIRMPSNVLQRNTAQCRYGVSFGVGKGGFGCKTHRQGHLQVTTLQLADVIHPHLKLVGTSASQPEHPLAGLPGPPRAPNRSSGPTLHSLNCPIESAIITPRQSSFNSSTAA